MKTIGWMVFCFALFGEVHGYPVEVIWSPRWFTEDTYWTRLIEETESNLRLVNSLDTNLRHMVRDKGETAGAVRGVTDLSKISEVVRGLTNKANSADSVAGKTDAKESLVSAPSRARSAISEEMVVCGKSSARDLGEFERVLAYEAVLGKARAVVESNRRTQKRLATRLRDAEEVLRSADTESELEVAQAEVQRITALIGAAGAAAQNMVEDVRLKKEEYEAGAEVEAIARTQELRQSGRVIADESEAQRTTYQRNLGTALADGAVEKEDKAKMFERTYK